MTTNDTTEAVAPSNPTSAVEADDGCVWVRRQWNGTSAKYLRADLTGVHWSQNAGGRGGRQPRQMIFGYVSCDGLVDGEIGHSGSHGPCPHSIKVCVVAKDNSSSTMALLRQQAGPPPQGSPSAAQRVIKVLEEAGGEMLNSELWSRALLSKAHGDEVLGRLSHKGLIESDTVTAPNRAGRPQRQKVWRLSLGSIDNVTNGSPDP